MNAGKGKNQQSGMLLRPRLRPLPGGSSSKISSGSQNSSSTQTSANAKKVPGKVATGRNVLAAGPSGSQVGGVVPRGAAQQTVAYLEPIDFGKEIPSHPVAVGKVLHEAGFDKCEEITKIGKFRYKVDLKSADDFTTLSNLNLNSANLKLFQPASHRETICFVPNVPLDFGDDEMKDQMECDYPITKVERIMRMGRNKQLK